MTTLEGAMRAAGLEEAADLLHVSAPSPAATSWTAGLLAIPDDHPEEAWRLVWARSKGGLVHAGGIQERGPRRGETWAVSWDGHAPMRLSEGWRLDSTDPLTRAWVRSGSTPPCQGEDTSERAALRADCARGPLDAVCPVCRARVGEPCAVWVRSAAGHWVRREPPTHPARVEAARSSEDVSWSDLAHEVLELRGLLAEVSRDLCDAGWGHDQSAGPSYLDPSDVPSRVRAVLDFMLVLSTGGGR